jgi:peptidoglycan hydrolase CwlO-like protein
MHKRTLVTLVGATLLLIGSTGPSCGGNQALQQQLDQLTTRDQEQTRTIQELQAQVKLLQTEMGNVKALTTQIGQTVLAQKQALEHYDRAIRTSRAAPVRRGSNGGKKAAKKPAKHAARSNRHH